MFGMLKFKVKKRVFVEISFFKIRLGLVRQIVQTTSDWYVQMNNSDGVLLMAKSYLIIDQPLAALEIYKKGLEKFPKDTVILSGIARCGYSQIGQQLC